MLKIYKQNCSFRIIISSIDSPLYALASYLNNRMFESIPMADKNSFELVDKLEDYMEQNHKLISLDCNIFIYKYYRHSFRLC